MAPRKGQLGSINAPSFETKKDKVSNDSKVEDLEWGPDQRFIYEVPRNIHQANLKAYTLLISIGPLHYRKTSLASMVKYKVDYEGKFLQRTSVSKEALESFWSFIERNEKNCWVFTEEEKKTSNKFSNQISLAISLLVYNNLLTKYNFK
ncbi:hypothetical protein ES332_A13G192700v1 [Gossypium tomentosum]|uniref:Uncharacterized protein n=1 Tax=Gossypium tomentosum TaxID=34277 RepID=A0A5D2MN57_GOSTO|nr:hypothetical protein ES332_A13G192700v1 [Gossypium tomentosum]